MILSETIERINLCQLNKIFRKLWYLDRYTPDWNVTIVDDKDKIFSKLA